MRFLMPEEWRLIPHLNGRAFTSSPIRASMNMAVDEAIAISSVGEGFKPAPTIRFYTWEKPAVTIGYSQRIAPVVDWLKHNSPHPSITKEGVDIVRRPTGGGIVLHGNDLTYSVIVKIPATTTRNQVPLFYELTGRAVIEGLKGLGLNADMCTHASMSNPQANLSMCAQTPVEFDVLVEGGKVAGCAARRFKETLLLQGFISLGQLIDIKLQDVADAVTKGFAMALDIELEEGKLTDEEFGIASELNDKKYCREEWNCKR